MKTWFVTVMALIGYMYASAQVAQPSHTDTAKTIRICTPSRSSVLTPPLYILFKGKQEVYRTNVGIPNIQPADIESIQVLKGTSATAKYGSKADYGVVEIYMKKGTRTDTSKMKPDTSKIKLHPDTGKAIRYRG